MDILYGEINTFCILIVGFILYKSQRLFTETDARRIFFWLLVTNMLLFAMDASWSYVNGRSGQLFYVLNLVMNSGYFVCSILVPYIWFLFSEKQLEAAWMEKRKYCCLAALPMAVAVALSLLSCYTGTFFTVSGNNVYARGPFYGIHILVGYGYVGITSLHCLLRALRTDSYVQRWKYLSLFFFVVPALIFSSLQEVFSGCAFLCLGNTLGLLSVFVNSLEQRISLDPLTQLNNRLQMERYLQQRIAHYQGGNPRQLYLVLVDVNNFKKINDTYGHVEGDRALQQIAEVLRQTARSGFAARYGGDEFVLILEAEEQQAVEQWCCDICRLLAELGEKTPYELTLSLGIACYTPEYPSIAAFIAAADVAMYDMKPQQA